MKDAIFKVIAAVGLLCLIVGTALYPVGTAGGNLPAVLSGIAAVLLLVSALANFRSIVAYFRERRGRRGAGAVFVTLLFTAILVMIQAISIRNTHRYDLTRNKRFTLSEQTTAMLRQMDGPISFTAFVRKNTVNWRTAASLLGMYAEQSRNVLFELVDPDEKPHIADRFRAKPGEVVVEYKGNRRTAVELTEESITNALLFVSRDRRKTIYFVSGHDEKRLDGTGSSGLTSARHDLEDTGYLTRELSLVGLDSIPADCAVLVLAGPKKEYLQSEVDLVKRYLAGGGRGLFLLDPPWPIDRLKPVLAPYRIIPHDYVLLDEVVIVDAGDEVLDATYTKIRTYGSHPITRGFRSITIFPVARPLTIAPDQGDLSVDAQYLAITENSAWGETDLEGFREGTATRDEEDIPPPLAVAAVSERTNRFDVAAGSSPDREIISKVVVVGDSDFATNRFYRLLGNSDFFLNSVEFLAQESVLITIRPKKDLGDRVFISASEGRLIFVLCLVLLPLMVASMGGYVMMKKRKT
ncbi:MAG: Gldg family protein [Candidatus Latescibacterota bacterium]